MKLAIQLLFTAAVLAGAAPVPHAGDLPSALSWDKLKGNCPSSLDWASLRGSVVVISMRDTFPGEFADWKRLTETFQGQSAIFLMSFSGSEFLLDQALEQSSFTGCVLFDEKKANLRSFGAARYSDVTAVVNDRGFIAGFGRDWEYQGFEPVVRSLLVHEPPTGLSDGAQRPNSQQSPSTPAAAPAPSTVVHISPSAKDERRALGLVLSKSAGHYASTNQPLRNIIFDLWDMPPTRISFPKDLDDTPYDVVANMPLDDEALVRTLLQEAIEKHFGLHIEKESRSMRAYALTAAQNLSPRLQLAQEGTVEALSDGDGSMSATAAEMKDLASAFEEMLGVPVIDQSGLPGNYQYLVSSKLQGPEAAFDMAHQLGLTLTETEQPIEMLVVTKMW